MESFHSVAVVGAGLSGLYAAQLLKSRFPDVVVLEAQGRIGGRVKQVHGLTPWPLEAGPEFVHGAQSIFVKIASELGCKFQEKEWPDWWYFAKEKLLTQDANVDDEVDQVHELFGNACDDAYPPPQQDISALDWLRQHGATEKQIAVADACYANDFGCSIQQLGLRETIEENRRWDSGETYLLMDRSMGHVVQGLARGLDIRTSWPVEAVEYSTWGVTLMCKDGRRLRCHKAVITVPLKLLQDGCITFTPPLPEHKQAAIQRIKMGNVIKLLLAFKECFWPEDMYDVVCTDSLVPEFWMLRNTASASSSGQGYPHSVVGFVAGDKAALISQMHLDQAVKAFLSQLDTIFGNDTNKTPATSAFAKAQVVDWSKEEYVRGAYTYPTLGAELGDRDALGAPVAGSLFFAGEATNASVNPCMQGALETAQRAARQVIAAASQPARQHTSKL